MKKNILLMSALTVLISLCLVFASCDSDSSDSDDPTPPPVPVTGVRLDPTTVELEVGGTQKLNVIITPEDATNMGVKWSSSDDSKVTVDEAGTITAIKAGEATITVTTRDGGRTATCEVTVKDIVSNVISYEVGAVLDFDNKKYGDKDIDISKPLVINGIEDTLKIVGTTDKALELFMTDIAATVNGDFALKDYTTIYIGGSKDENGNITTGTNEFNFASSGNNYREHASKIYANTTGTIILANETRGSKIDLSLVEANIGNSLINNGNLGENDKFLQLDGGTAAYLTNVSGDDTLSYTVGGSSITKVIGTAGKDTIGINNDATALKEIDLMQGGGNDVAKLNANVWSFSKANSVHFKIDVKSGDKAANIAFDNFKGDNVSETAPSDEYTPINMAISGLIKEADKTAYFMTITAGGNSHKYLVYNLDGTDGLDDNDVVIEIVGANSASADGDVITFTGN